MCEFKIFLDLIGITGSHPNFTLLGKVSLPAPSPPHTQTPGNLGWQRPPGNVSTRLHSTSVLEKPDEGKGQQVAGENSMDLIFQALVSPYCVLAVGREVEHRASATPLVPTILKHTWKTCASEEGVF